MMFRFYKNRSIGTFFQKQTKMNFLKNYRSIWAYIIDKASF